MQTNSYLFQKKNGDHQQQTSRKGHVGDPYYLDDTYRFLTRSKVTAQLLYKVSSNCTRPC